MKKTVAVVLLAAVLAALSIFVGRRTRVSARGASSIGYVSLQRILNESPEQKAGASRLQQIQQEKGRGLAGMQQKLDATRRQLAQSSSGAARAELQRDEQQQRGELERATAQAQADLQALQRQFQNDLRSRLTPVFEDIAKSRNMQIVLNEDTGVVWAAPAFDLTNDVIERLKAGSAERERRKP